MNAPIRALLLADARNVTRDDLLIMLLPYPFILGLVLRWLVPFAQRGLAQIYDIMPLYPLLASYFGAILMPAMAGMLVGLLFLDERDTGTLRAIEVTPFSTYAYFGYRLILPMVLGFVSVFVIVPLMGIVQVNYLALVPIGLVASLTAPLIAMILVTFAANKVQGLAVMKAASLLLSLTFIAWFVPEPWQWLFGILPTYWPAKAFQLQIAGEPWLWTLWVGMVVAMVWNLPLLRNLGNATRRTG